MAAGGGERGLLPALRHCVTSLHLELCRVGKRYVFERSGGEYKDQTAKILTCLTSLKMDPLHTLCSNHRFGKEEGCSPAAHREMKYQKIMNNTRQCMSH